MIRINLLPKQKRVSVTNVEKEFVLFLLLIVFMAASLFSFNIWMQEQVGALRSEKKQKEGLRATLQVKVDKVNSIKKDLDEIQRKIQIIKEVRTRQGLPIQFIDEVVRTIPPEKIWFESFTMDGKGAISIKGVAMDNQAFALYVNNLRQSLFISSVVTQKTSRREIQGLGLVEFSFNITAQEPKEQHHG
jgi:type IV pilus assembly protein PilN